MYCPSYLLLGPPLLSKIEMYHCKDNRLFNYYDLSDHATIEYWRSILSKTFYVECGSVCINPNVQCPTQCYQQIIIVLSKLYLHAQIKRLFSCDFYKVKIISLVAKV